MYGHIVEVASQWAAIWTALVASIASVVYWCDFASKRKKLETYLSKEKAASPDKPMRSVVHLMARLGLSEAEVLQASFRSKHIIRKLHVDRETNLANEILFEYSKTEVIA